MRILYADGSGNKYIITDAKCKTIEYVPVKPVSSSSGIYDGGIPIKKKLSDAGFSRIYDAIAAALNAPHIHTKERIMGSGLIAFEKDERQQSCILKPNAPERVNIESMLKELLD